MIKPKKRKIRADKGKKRGKRVPKKPIICKLCGHESMLKTQANVHYLSYHATLDERKAGYKCYCEICNVGYMSQILYDKHITTTKHRKLTLLQK